MSDTLAALVKQWRELLIDADSMLSAWAHHRPIGRDEALMLSAKIRRAYESHEAKEALAAIVAPQPEGWQPIETAPKDGRRLLMCLGEDRVRFPDPCVLRWGIDGTGEYEGWIDAEEFAPDPQPTAWMPLPSAPGVDRLAPQPQTEKE